MARSNTIIALTGLLALLLRGSSVRAEGFADLQAVEPIASVPDILKSLPRVPDQPSSLFEQAEPEHSTQSPLPDRYFVEDPLLDPPDMPRPGWYGALEVQLAAPHIYKSLFSTVTAGSRGPDAVNLQNRGLAWTAAPRIELGYRLPSGFGGFVLGYRTLSSSGDFSSNFLGPDGPATLRSRLSMHIVDLDYETREFTPFTNWEMRWRFGGRFTQIYYDTVLNQSVAEASAGSGILQQRASNFFTGFGPHVGVELKRHFTRMPGLSFLGRVDYGSQLGRIKQGFYETAQDPLAAGGASYGQNVVSSSQTLQTISVLAGLNWQSSGGAKIDVFAGYQYDYWFDVGRFSLEPNSRGELCVQGLLVRLRFNY